METMAEWQWRGGMCCGLSFPFVKADGQHLVARKIRSYWPAHARATMAQIRADAGRLHRFWSPRARFVLANAPAW